MLQDKENRILKAKMELDSMKSKYKRTIEEMEYEYNEKLKRK